jgi:hypothetical protein
VATEAIIFQQIVDINWDQAIYTASPNSSINVVQFAAKGSGTNIGIALTPKGTGYISAQVPDGTTTGGNARGANSVDFQAFRTSASEVASGQYAFAVGNRCTASGASSIAMGERSSATALRAIAIGDNSTASGTNSFAIGSSTATTVNSFAFGSSLCAGDTAFAIGDRCEVASGASSSLATGFTSKTHFESMRAHGGASLSTTRGAAATQEIAIILGGRTTTNTEVVLSIRSTIKPVLRAGSVWSGIVHIIGSKSDGTAIANYQRQVTISRVVNATALVGTVNTIGSDTAAGTSINITADDTNEALSVGVTGVSAETWRWVAVFHGAELAIGS